MCFHLDWGTYADWLIKIEGLDPIEAINRVSVAYKKQYGKVFEQEQTEQILDYIEKRF